MISGAQVDDYIVLDGTVVDNFANNMVDALCKITGYVITDIEEGDPNNLRLD